jgi:hypothetical protein
VTTKATQTTPVTKKTTPAPSIGRPPIFEPEDPIENSAGRLAAVSSVAVAVCSLYTLSLGTL